MSIRLEVEELVRSGPLPSEEATEEEIAQAQHLLDRITPPVSDEEAQALTAAFGPDDCYGLSWTLLHLIETAPHARDARYRGNATNTWVQLLNARAGAAQTE
ncbi:hypothetical protein FM076_12445 [Streptomyces albus subsp. chlorinus]|uniref:hypothetical protein n=1 Tax=Streptomyces albus TaxID=1888 RepID=UPI00156F494E|nr:hypothetical protein [Streptomyces albus]NSC21964.1 hypothetical protein [Streptomyces albus subsp. chlorinus]